jgi:hypothetical protein
MPHAAAAQVCAHVGQFGFGSVVASDLDPQTFEPGRCIEVIFMQHLPAAKLLHPVLQSERENGRLCAAIKVANTSRERVAVKIKKSRAENKHAKGRARASLSLSLSLFKYIPGRKVLTPVCIAQRRKRREM